MQHFNSIEETKDFLLTEDAQVFGNISFIDPNSGEATSLTIKEFIEKVGLDKAAEFVFANQGKMIEASLGSEDFQELIEQFATNPDALSDKDKMKVIALLNSIKSNANLETKSELFDIITKVIIDDSSSLFKSYSGILALMLTYLEGALITGSYLSKYADNATAMLEIAKVAQSKITIADDIDDEMLMLGLIHVIGNRFISKNSTLGFGLDFESLMERLNIDKEFVYECNECATKDCGNCPKKQSPESNAMPINPRQDLTKNTPDRLFHAMNNIPDQLKKLSNSKTLEAVTTENIAPLFNDDNDSISKLEKESSGGKIIDIRERLRRRD